MGLDFIKKEKRVKISTKLKCLPKEIKELLRGYNQVPL